MYVGVQICYPKASDSRRRTVILIPFSFLCKMKAVKPMKATDSRRRTVIISPFSFLCKMKAVKPVKIILRD